MALLGLGGRQLKHEVGRKAFVIAPHGLVEVERRDAVKRGEITVEHDFLAANFVNQPIEIRARNRQVIFAHGPAVCRRQPVDASPAILSRARQ